MIELAEVAWRKSSYSNGVAECVEVAELPDGSRAVRDTKDGGRGPVLRFTAGEWTAFAHGVKNGELDD